jgi:hypothetical protein
VGLREPSEHASEGDTRVMPRDRVKKGKEERERERFGHEKDSKKQTESEGEKTKLHPKRERESSREREFEREREREQTQVVPGSIIEESGFSVSEKRMNEYTITHQRVSVSESACECV